ncbi:efflux RND transporter periplasmic adaptor subunit [Gilvimarinus agarilyticus]|uniref:efflux RND transporter periplasmic adaptor subunit n=1 Tax=Gilvimarinus sp. 2_MG-2023 TaxID=3062666 RepID=UPI001C0A247B|nr:efflux RND transporter periplasmic adaptor subunit [Gilvimarinus sp. 2_MG-2023]MBU2886932.1 efflux RND transporter periplasmic adaptor subunit [Gilvimarinus agarilyticus]MDO6571592.1 efflux RND transporter periplasmic adaptor subunit [Gilvimarinus sp. 2_MG-2023]
MQTPGFLGRNIRWIAPLLIIVISIALLILMKSLRPEPAAKPPVDSTVLVETREIALSAKRLDIQTQGLVKAKYSTELVAQVSGEIIELSPAFVRGGLVQQGDILAQIDPTNYQVALENARAGLASAESALEQEMAQGEVARVEWEAVNDRPAPALGLRKPQLEQAQARVVAAQADLKMAQKNLDRTYIKAPYDALIVERLVSLGSFLNVGAKLGQLMDVSSAEIRLPVATTDQQFLPNGGVGVEVTLSDNTSPNLDGAKWQARIVRSEGVIDENTRMHYLVAEVSDPYNLHDAQAHLEPLTFGRYVVAQLAGINLPSAVEINRSLVKDGKVAVLKNGKLHFKPVTVVRHDQGQSVISAGLAQGDQLITTAIEFPVQGMTLKLRSEVSETQSDDELGAQTNAPTTAEQGDA